MTKKIPVTPVLTTRRRSPRGNNNLSPLAPDTNSTEPTSTPIITNITTNTTTMVDNLQPSPTNNKAYNIQPVEDSMNQDDQTSSLPQDKYPYKTAVNTSPTSQTIKPPLRTTFILQKEICDKSKESIDISDDVTINGSSDRNVLFPNNVRMTMMFKIPDKQEGCTEKDAPLVAIKKINEMLSALTNKLPCRVGPWTFNSLSSKVPADSDLLKLLPKDVDFVESYVYDYNRFISPGKTGYVRLNIYYSDLTSISDIKSVVSQFKKARERFMEVSHSNALSPIQIGTLTGSVKAMADSIDFKEVMMKKFDLSELGLWFGQPRTTNYSGFDSNKFTLHLEIDRKDLPKRLIMEQYFNHGQRNVSTTFFGTPMLLAKPFDYFAEDDVKENIDMHARKQASLGKSIRSTTIHGVQLNNWSSSAKDKTLLHELMHIESITSKKIIKGKTSSTFKGRLFYAIVPDKIMKTVTFYYSRANYTEGRSIARGLPLFIRDHFILDPAFFCTSEAITDALDGDWNFELRKFLSSDERIERENLDLMEDEVNAEPEVFISKDHQRALAMDDDDEVSIETRLTKGDAAPPAASNDDLSDMTGSTRESKAKAYADSAVKEVAAQYSETITNMSTDLGAKEDKIAQLEIMLAKFKQTSTLDNNIIIDLQNNNNIEEEDLTQEVLGIDINDIHEKTTPARGDDDSVPSRKRSLDQHSSPNSHSSRRKLYTDPSLNFSPPPIQPITPSSPNKEDMLL